MAAIYLFVLFTCFIQIAFFGFIYIKYLRLDTAARPVEAEALQPVSVVICAHNEAENIKKYLPVVMDQAYPEYEVIVVDDASTDGTQEILTEYEDRYPNLLIFRIDPSEQSHGGKKQAISHGVALAKYHWILVTDADCCPASNRWIAQMGAALSEGHDIVLGVSPYFSADGWWRSFFRAEAGFIALQYINFLLAGLPFMGVGRNMAYRREIFDNHDIAAHWDLLSGDDDLFVNEMADSANVGVAVNPDAYTYSESPTGPGAWCRQKLRHYTTGYRYNLLQKIWLAYYWLSSLLLYIMIPVTVIHFLPDPAEGAFLTAILAMTAILRWTVLGLSLRKMGSAGMLWSVPIFDFAYILSVWVLSPLAGLGWDRWK